MTEVRPQREEGDSIREEEDVEEEDNKRRNMRKLKRNLLTSPKLSATIFKRWGTLPVIVILKKKKKGKDEKVNIAEKSKEKSALIILSDSEFSEQLLQGNGEEVNCELWYLGLQGQVAI